ncbi:MAG: dTDP-4-dehydrorhamnose 3,5-epimerase [Alphaproteobacteria bacterium]|nr:dTDP-4-dehydrorhamnose 3,5-epimerase [Alphaproteobacteria bacterium]
MNIIKTHIDGVYILEPKIHRDGRGYFVEPWNERTFRKNGFRYSFVQDNQSFSHYGTVRALHFQRDESAQAKLVRALQGRVMDVAVDLRPASPTFGQHVAVELDDHLMRMLMIPRGFAHGFSVLSETAVFGYKVDNFYNKEAEGGLLFNDSELGIDWGVPTDKIIASERDRLFPTLAEYKKCTR